MDDIDTANLMRRCRDEIRSLQARVAQLEPKAHAYDALTTVIGLLPRPAQGYAPDLAWMLDRDIAALETKMSQAVETGVE